MGVYSVLAQGHIPLMNYGFFAEGEEVRKREKENLDFYLWWKESVYADEINPVYAAASNPRPNFQAYDCKHNIRQIMSGTPIFSSIS